MRITGYRHKEDFDRLMQINDACYFGEYRPPRKIVSDMISVSDVLIARGSHVDPETLVGFAIMKDAENVPAYLWNIAVDPEYQGRGVGGNILREIIKKYTLSKRMGISLHVNVNNPAQKLYYDYGFRVTSLVKDYFKPDDGLYMLRRLP